ncbi:MAG: flagellar hook-associated protein FlgK [Lachnospira sp.]|nr:flagellar hook-associated protein FlgK [Lachnospira sp.]
MASTFFGLTIAYSGLQAAQTSLTVAGHNISNINTEGYSRQQAETYASRAIRTYATYGTLGSGVTVGSINQLRDSYYDVKYRNNQSNNGEYATKSNYMNQVEDYLNEFILEGFTTEYRNFYEAVNQLTITPGDASSKNQLINNGKSFADYLNTLCTNLRNVQEDINNEVKDTVERINSIAKNIAAINRQINQIEANFGNANDLRDKRNAMVDELSELVNIDTTEEQMGNDLTNYTIRINGQSLVSGYSYNTLEVVSREDPRNITDADGLYDITWNSGQPFDIYSDTLGGSLRGLIDMRDGCNGEIESIATDEAGNFLYDSDGNRYNATTDTPKDNTEYKGVPYYQARLNKFAHIFAEAVNDILKSGYSSDGQHKGVSLFVTQNNTSSMTASNITVNYDLLKNPDLLAIKSMVNTGESNADIMEQLNALQTAKIFDNGVATYYLETMVSDMSIDTQKASNLLKNHENLKTSIHNQRLSVMGVDIPSFSTAFFP